MHAVDALRLEHQFGKRQRKQRADFLAGPVVADKAQGGAGGDGVSERHGGNIDARNRL